MNSIYDDVLKHNKTLVNAKRILIGTATACFEALILFHLRTFLKPLTKMQEPRLYKRQFMVLIILLHTALAIQF